MIKLPRYIKCISIPDDMGRVVPEWVIRIYDNQMENEHGDKVATPHELLNRYYTVKSPFLGVSIYTKRPNKNAQFMTIEELEAFRCQDRLEYS